MRHDALHGAQRRLRTLIETSDASGIDPRRLARWLDKEFPELAEVLRHELLVRWVRDFVRGLRDDAGLPLVGSFGGVAVQRVFWDLAMYRRRHADYLRAAGACQRIATELLAEAERRFGQGRAQILAPRLSGDQRRQAAAPDLSDPDPPTRA
jgi:hypothetical protein